MSLDAVVFKSKELLANTLNTAELTLINPDTGEYEFSDHVRPSPPAVFIDEGRSLGNIARAAYIREIATPKLSLNSVLLKQVVYNGIHSGDMIGMQDLWKLRSELETLADDVSLKDDSVMHEFIQDMTALIDAAIKNNNPIVFV